VKSSNLQKCAPPPFGVKHNIKKGTKREESCSKRKYTIAFESRLSVASLLAARSENPKRTIERVANPTAPAVKELSTFHLYFCSHISFHKQFVLHQFDEPQRKLLYHVTSVWFSVWWSTIYRAEASLVNFFCCLIVDCVLQRLKSFLSNNIKIAWIFTALISRICLHFINAWNTILGWWRNDTEAIIKHWANPTAFKRNSPLPGNSFYHTFTLRWLRCHKPCSYQSTLSISSFFHRRLQQTLKTRIYSCV